MLRLALLAALIAIPAMAQTITIQPSAPGCHTETRTFALQSGGRLKVSNIDGNIRVTAWDKNEVELIAKFTPDSDSQHVRLEVQSAEGSFDLLEISARRPKSKWDLLNPRWWSDSSYQRGIAHCQMELKVPHKLIGNFHAVDGNITLESISGDNNAKTVDGNINFKNIQRRFNASTVDGDIKGFHDGPEDGMELSTVDGNIKLKMQNPKGKLTASCLDGSITFNAQGASDIQTSKRNVNATFGQGGQPISLRTVDGSIVIY